MELTFIYAETPTSIAARMIRPDDREARIEERRRIGRASRQIFERMFFGLNTSRYTVKEMRFEMQPRGGMNLFLFLQVEGRGWVSERGFPDIRVEGVDGETFLHLKVVKCVRVPATE